MLKPELMIPCYRHGQQTPWGGTALHDLFGRDIPDEHTGESLEVSAIPGLNSCLTDGTFLSDYLSLHGEKALGKGRLTLPLLLKLLDARDTLSVQVHPDDRYAMLMEGKRGKTEAWHILAAREDSFLIYGLQGISNKEELRQAAVNGKIERYLRKITVHAGETYYIPAGTVHAIGKGLMIYEIQQSSDITYRFYDWNRTDPSGRRRPLHIDRAAEAANPVFSGSKAEPSVLSATRELLLEERFFSLERWHDTHDERLNADGSRFYFLTALGNTFISWQDGDLHLHGGDTAFIPADCIPLTIDSDEMLLAYPTTEVNHVG